MKKRSVIQFKEMFVAESVPRPYNGATFSDLYYAAYFQFEQDLKTYDLLYDKSQKLRSDNGAIRIIKEFIKLYEKQQKFYKQLESLIKLADNHPLSQDDVPTWINIQNNVARLINDIYYAINNWLCPLYDLKVDHPKITEKKYKKNPNFGIRKNALEKSRNQFLKLR